MPELHRTTSISFTRRERLSQAAVPPAKARRNEALPITLVIYVIEGGEPALMAYRRWRNISRDDLATKSGISRPDIDAIEDGTKEIDEARTC